MSVFEGKTIIHSTPKLFNLDSVIEAGLKAVGFTWINILTLSNTIRYGNFYQRLTSFLEKKLRREPHCKRT